MLFATCCSASSSATSACLSWRCVDRFAALHWLQHDLHGVVVLPGALRLFFRQSAAGHMAVRLASPHLFSAWHPLSCCFLTLNSLPYLLQDQAVAPGQGGIIPRDEAPASAAAAPKALPSGKPPPVRLCVVDPLTGRDVAGGAHRISQARR